MSLVDHLRGRRPASGNDSSRRGTPHRSAEGRWVSLDVVRHAAVTGAVPSQIIEHNIISIQRDEILAWLEASDGRQRGGRARNDS